MNNNTSQHNNWHTPIMKKYGFQLRQVKNNGQSLEFRYKHNQSKRTIICTSTQHADRWADVTIPKLYWGGEWHTLEAHLKSD